MQLCRTTSSRLWRQGIPLCQKRIFARRKSGTSPLFADRVRFIQLRTESGMFLESDRYSAPFWTCLVACRWGPGYSSMSDRRRWAVSGFKAEWRIGSHVPRGSLRYRQTGWFISCSWIGNMGRWRWGLCVCLFHQSGPLRSGKTGCLLKREFLYCRFSQWPRLLKIWRRSWIRNLCIRS